MATEDPKKNDSKDKRPDKMEVIVDHKRVLNGGVIEEVRVEAHGDATTGEIVYTMTVRTVGRDAEGVRRLCHRSVDDAFEVGPAIDRETGTVRKLSGSLKA